MTDRNLAAMNSMQRMTAIIDLVDGRRYRTTMMPGDVVACERRYNVSATVIDADPKLEHVLYMAWVASTRSGYVADFETFVVEVANVGLEAEPEGPTRPAP